MLHHPFIVFMGLLSDQPLGIHAGPSLFILCDGVRARRRTSQLSQKRFTSGVLPRLVPDRLASLYASQIVLIFEHLHDKNIVFRDLKP